MFFLEEENLCERRELATCSSPRFRNDAMQCTYSAQRFGQILDGKLKWSNEKYANQAQGPEETGLP